MQKAGILVAFGLGALATAAAGDALVLLDGPRGAWLGEIRVDAPLQVVEEKEGWRHVRLDGWIRVGSSPAAETAPGPEAPVPHALQAQGTSLSGVLTALPGMEPATPGTNLVVWLLADSDTLAADHQALGETCRKTLAALDARIAELNDTLRHALNANDNFRQAASQNDHAKSDLAAAQKSRDKEIAGCREKADELFSTRALTRTLSDGAGRFDFQGLAAGRYRVVATERNTTGARAWSLAADVNGAKPMVLEARAAAGPDPYWNLH
jgi:hypothetical protein